MGTPAWEPQGFKTDPVDLQQESRFGAQFYEFPFVAPKVSFHHADVFAILIVRLFMCRSGALLRPDTDMGMPCCPVPATDVSIW